MPQAKTPTALAVAEPATYPALAASQAELMEAIQENFGGERLNVRSLQMLTVGTPAKFPKWTVLDVETGEYVEREHVDGIVIHTSAVRGYWQHAYDGTANPPTCWSDDCLTGRGEPGGSCLTCPLNQFGSAAVGEGKACREFVYVFILTADSVLPLVVKVPPTSLGALREYRKLCTQRSKPLSALVTRFGLESSPKANLITFKATGSVPSELRGRVKALAAEFRAVLDSVDLTAATATDGASSVNVEFNFEDGDEDLRAEWERAEVDG